MKRPMEMRPIPFGRPESLVRLADGRLVLRLSSPAGERMATRLRAMTTRDAFAPLRRYRRSCG
jgi:hypothetical protein